ncbi:hypothetical protein ABK040_000775 [Willaertia magna]
MTFADEKIYENYEIKEIKLNSMKEILNEINHSHLFNLTLQFKYFNDTKYYLYLLPSLKYLFLNVKLKNNKNITLQNYVLNLLQNFEKRNELERLYFSEKDKITSVYNVYNNMDSDFIIYFIYKKFYYIIDEFERYYKFYSLFYRSQTAYVPKQQTNKKKELTKKANTRKQSNKLEQNLIERNTTQNLIVNKTDTNSILTRLDLYSKRIFNHK